MARDINERLMRLNDRRKGRDRLAQLNESARYDVLAKSLNRESWERRAPAQPYTRYALGAMQPVGAEYTQKSIESAERVGKQLETALVAAGRPVTFKLQGSVPLDVHIRGVSDVDLLTLDRDFYTYARAGLRSLGGWYSGQTSETSLGVLGTIRSKAEEKLKTAYPSAVVDCSGGKCIAISGGSLERPVDVVPAHWHDTVDYQQTGAAHDRGVTILNKKVPETVANLPFLHMKLISDRDGIVLGGLRKAIRLTKTVKSDATNQTGVDNLPSFDIAALLYHANQEALRVGYLYELAILEETQRFFDWCYRNQEQAKLYRTPDGSRAVLNTPAKMDGLLHLSVELDDLARSVRAEHLGGSLRNVVPAAA